MTHIVKQGEHLSGIAENYGFSDYRTIWNHPDNAELKRKRRNPHVLFPGDVLFVPERGEKVHEASTERRHKFVLRQQNLVLRLSLERGYVGPAAGRSCELQVEFDRFDLETDDSGRLEQEISARAVQARLNVHDVLHVKEQKVAVDLEIPIKIGYLDPVEEPTGQRGRLLNLGYYRGRIDQSNERDFKSAVEEFQCEHDLLVDGICGPRTQAKMVVVHGC